MNNTQLEIGKCYANVPLFNTFKLLDTMVFLINVFLLVKIIAKACLAKRQD